MSNLAFSQVIRRLDALGVHEGPQRGFEFQDITASARGPLVLARRTFLEERVHALLNRLHLLLESAARKGSVPHAVPPLKHGGGFTKKCLTNAFRCATALHERLEIRKEVGPTELSLAECEEIVAAPAMGTEDAFETLAQQFLSNFPTATAADQKHRHEGTR